MTTSIVQQADIYATLRAHQQGLDALRRSDGSNRWILVGDDTDPESPPFENGWTNIAGAYHPVAFKRFLNWVHNGGPDNSVVFTLPQAYWPTAVMPLSPGTLADFSGAYSLWIGTDGTVNYVTAHGY